jgi:hypothetical protein
VQRLGWRREVSRALHVDQVFLSLVSRVWVSSNPKTEEAWDDMYIKVS